MRKHTTKALSFIAVSIITAIAICIFLVLYLKKDQQDAPIATTSTFQNCPTEDGFIEESGRSGWCKLTLYLSDDNLIGYSILYPTNWAVYRGCINKMSHVGDLPNLRSSNLIEAR
jgi:hypothetical protein